MKWLAAILLLALPLQAEASSRSKISQGATEWTAKGGFAWSGLAARYGVSPRIATLAEVETALFVRWEGRAGLQIQWLESEAWALDTTLALGAVRQDSTVSRQGPQGSFVVRISKTGNVEPYLALHNREFLSMTSTKVLSEEDTTTRWEMELLHARGGTLGVVFPTTKHFMFDIGLQMGSMDSAFAIPSFFTAVHWRPSK